ncbi:MAG: tetratricopeptide repeat protein [Candidatus Eremiobacterota bacterium]
MALTLALLVVCLAAPGLAQETLMDGGSALTEAMQAMQAGNLIKLREKAHEILKANPDSIPGNYFMGYSLHQAEGDLPRARYHLNKARRLFEKRFGATPNDYEPVFWLLRILAELESVNAEMDLYAEQVEVLDAINAVHRSVPGGEPPVVVEYAWPLMKLGREREARDKVRQVLDDPSAPDRMIALNTLGAIEMETGNTQRSYEVFQQLIQEGGGLFGGCTILRNAGEASLMVGRFPDAERYFLQATEYFEPRGFSNPWWDLANLYLAEARFPEAVEALKNCHMWTFRMEAYLAQQNLAENMQVTAEILLQLGFSREALSAARAAVLRPDRQGGNSNQRDQWEAGNLILYRAALLARDQAIQEEMSWSRGARWWELYLERQKLGFQAWTAGREATSIAVRNGRLQKSLRVYSAGTVMMADWHRPDLVALYGPGVTAAALRELRADKFDDMSHQEPYLRILDAEVLALTGKRAQAIARLDEALKTLNEGEALVRARALARAGSLERDTRAAVSRYQRVLEVAPAMIRHLNLSLPIRVEGGGSGPLKEAASRILSSPRFHADDDGFRLVLDGSSPLSARLLAPDGTVLATSTGKDALDLVQAVHQDVLAPPLNLSQTDLNSLDGSNLSGTVKTTRLKELFQSP